MYTTVPSRSPQLTPARSLLVAYVLIVDADRTSRRILRTILEDHGHEVQEVEGGAEGLRRIESRPPDLVITELYLDEVDGIELLRALRKRWSRRPIVVSASREHHTCLHVARMAMVLGASGFIEKPPNRSGVVALVKGLVA